MIAFSGDEFYCNLNSLSKNVSMNDCDVFNKRGKHFIHIKINSLLPKNDEVCYNANITNVPIILISNTKLDENILPSKLKANGYDLVKLNWSMRGGSIVRYMKSSIA